MKPEVARSVEQANIVLARAAVMLTVDLTIDLNGDAARAAYLASFHMAQAYVFARTGKVSKTHRGVQGEFFRLTNDDPRIDTGIGRFLARSYEFKSIADYFSGPSPIISSEDAIAAVATARTFVAHFVACLSTSDSATDTDVDSRT